MPDSIEAKRPENSNDRRHQIFPTLSEAQFEILTRYGERRRFKAGEVLFREGDRHVPMYVIVSGAIAIERGGVNGPHHVVTDGPGVFTGEVGTLAGRAAIATGKVSLDTEAIVIDEASLRTLVIVEAELSELIMRAFILRRVAFIQDVHGGGVTMIGSRHSSDTFRLREFLARNGQPVAYFDVDEHSDTAELLQRFALSLDDLPAVIDPRGGVLRRPSIRQVADAIGISPDSLEGRRFDLAVVGAGPAGLAAAVYAASEGLKVIVLDSQAPGGQAGSSSKIENYFGFPTGISGQALAGRGLSQARKFGAEVAVPIEVTSLACNAERGFDLTLDDQQHIHARSMVIATGARYRKPVLANLEQFEGQGIYYGASFMEGNLCLGEDIAVVGGGNSAGQAAVFLSSLARHVHVIVRGQNLAASMSRYLIQRIEAMPNITLLAGTEIIELIGTSRLEKIRWRRQDGAIEEREIANVFLFLGAQPNTGWLGGCVKLDADGFVLTGASLGPHDWPLSRAPHALETSRPGVFAVGDVRCGSVKRVAAAVGEGSIAVQALHDYLASVAA
jgi:thioredoxin reductase (NADPH)